MTRAMTRRGLVLGAGGVLGAAWSIGALCALEEVEGWDPRDAEFIVGTSAGSVIAAALAAGVSVAALRDHQLGLPLPDGLTVAWDHETATGTATPARPALQLGSRALLRRGALHPRRVPASAMFWALVPPGRRDLDALRHMVDSLVPDGAWAPHAGLWITAMNYETGERTVFGREGAPSATLTQAVIASCAIPGWYSPEIIDGLPFIDGGACSATNADLLEGCGLDEIYVIAPMCSFAMDRPGTMVGRLERRWRRRTTRRLLREAGALEAAGTTLTLLAPGPDDLRAMGANLMDPVHRLAVLESSLRTSVAALRDPLPDDTIRAM